ncbi:MAG TPA: putative 2OG-Fe(II) oxygenase [Allosphingosinicella sp.]|nr:putative 2OG-Fe(II) oxygenase [Allosphingosinicella sp.]
MNDTIRLALAVAAAPADAAARRAFAVALAKGGEARAALDQYRALLALRPNDPDAAADMGLMARRCGREEEVLPVLRRAADAHPRHARLWQVLGLIYRSLDEMEASIASFDHAAALAPRDVLIAHGRARSLFDAGLPSAECFEQAHRLAPHDKSVIAGLAAALNGEGRSADGATLLEEELARAPTWWEGHATLTRYRWAMGDRTGFTRSLEEALQSAPGDIDLWRELLITHIHANNYDAALEIVARGRAVAGPHPMFDANEATCHAELGNVEAADRLFAAIGPAADFTVTLRQVRHYMRTGRLVEAERLAVEATEAGEDAYWPYLATIWRMTGNPMWEWLEGDQRLVGTYDLYGAVGSMEALAETLRSLHTSVQQPLDQSLRGGTQTDGMLFSRLEPEVKRLRAAVKDAVTQHVAQLPPRDMKHPQLRHRRGSPVRFSGSWSVRLTSGGSHVNHIHPAGWFSSAFYVALPDETRHGAAAAGWLTLGEPPADLHLGVSPFRLVEPKPGQLVLFPSTMWHGTRPFAQGERMTVAFDVAPPV